MKYKNLEKYNPVYVINAIQKLKYKIAIIPMAMVAVAFFTNMYISAEWSKYLSLIGLLLYFVVAMLFKVNRRMQYRDAEPIQVFPLSGRIIKVDGNILTIKKLPLGVADIRFSGIAEKINFVSGKTYIYDKSCNTAGQLIGVAPYAVTYTIELTEEQSADFQLGDNILSGDLI